MAYSDVEKDMAKRILKHHCSSWHELRYDEIRNKPYFIGKRFKDSETEILFPMNCYKSMSFDELRNCIIDSGSTSMNLAVYNTDSTVVLYKAQLGLKSPISLKEDEISPLPDSNVAGSSKKRKTDTVSNSTVTTSVCTEQNEAGVSTYSYDIDLQVAVDSDLNETENEDSGGSNNNCSSNQEEVICP